MEKEVWAILAVLTSGSLFRDHSWSIMIQSRMTRMTLVLPDHLWLSNAASSGPCIELSSPVCQISLRETHDP